MNGALQFAVQDRQVAKPGAQNFAGKRALSLLAFRQNGAYVTG